jgi:hypothetical protein
VDLDTGGDEGNSMEVLYGATARVTPATTTQVAELRGKPVPGALPAEAP